MNYDETIERLANLVNYVECDNALHNGHNQTHLTPLDLIAINNGISAIKTLQDMKCHSGTTYGKLTKRVNKPYRKNDRTGQSEKSSKIYGKPIDKKHVLPYNK